MSRKSSSEFLSSLDVASEVLKAIADEIRRVGGDPDVCLRSLLNDEIRLKAVALAAIRPEPGSATTVETVTVPDLSASALVAAVKKEAGLTWLNVAYVNWNFINSESNKTYEVATWAPGHEVSSADVKEHFAALGGKRPFIGNTAVFLQWIRMNRRDGWFVSILEDDRLFRDANDDLCAPYFGRVGADRYLGLFRVAGDWDAAHAFVAFRECL